MIEQSTMFQKDFTIRSWIMTAVSLAIGIKSLDGSDVVISDICRVCLWFVNEVFEDTFGISFLISIFVFIMFFERSITVEFLIKAV